MSAKQLQDCILQIVEQEEGLTLDDITARCKESFAESPSDCNGILTKEVVRDEVIELSVRCVVQMKQEFMGHDWTYWKGRSWMAENNIDVMADRIVELVKGIDDWGDAGSAVSRLLRAEDRRLTRAVDEVQQQPSFTAQVRSALSGDHPESEAFLSLLADEMRREIERLRVHRDAWQDALYCIREQYGEEATTGSEQAEFAMTICDKIRAKALGLLLDEFKSEAAAAAGGK